MVTLFLGILRCIGVHVLWYCFLLFFECHLIIYVMYICSIVFDYLWKYVYMHISLGFSGGHEFGISCVFLSLPVLCSLSFCTPGTVEA